MSFHLSPFLSFAFCVTKMGSRLCSLTSELMNERRRTGYRQDVFLLDCVAGVKCLGTELQELGRERCYDWRIVLLLSYFLFL